MSDDLEFLKLLDRLGGGSSEDFNTAVLRAVQKMHDAYMKPRRPTRIDDRANEAKEDYLATQIPGSLYRLMKEDIGAVWGLLESPLEQVALFQLAAENYSMRPDWPVYAKVARERGQFSHKHYPVQIIPQVTFGPYRVDFLFDIGERGLIAVECDGAEYHQDKARDKARDEHLKQHFNVGVLRAEGRFIWRNNETAHFFADVVRARLL